MSKPLTEKQFEALAIIDKFSPIEADVKKRFAIHGSTLNSLIKRGLVEAAGGCYMITDLGDEFVPYGQAKSQPKSETKGQAAEVVESGKCDQTAAAGFKFYLGASEASWLWDKRHADTPLFVSAIRLRRKVNLKPALMDWALDSGGFSVLSKDGQWPVTPEEYVTEVRRYVKEIGRMQWAASMDWMCEDKVRELTNAKDAFDCYGDEDHLVSLYMEGTDIHELDAREDYRRARVETIVEEHQRRTVANYLRLCELAPEIKWVPTIQGWGDSADDEESTIWSYSQHVEMYYEAGVELHTLDTVGVGSVCRRQNMGIGSAIIKMLYTSYGLENLHGFGFKTTGLKSVGHLLKSADSMAWSFAARRRKIQLEGCTHKYCNVCHKWSEQWRKDMLAGVNETEFVECGKPAYAGPYQEPAAENNDCNGKPSEPVDQPLSQPHQAVNNDCDGNGSTTAPKTITQALLSALDLCPEVDRSSSTRSTSGCQAADHWPDWKINRQQYQALLIFMIYNPAKSRFVWYNYFQLRDKHKPKGQTNEQAKQHHKQRHPDKPHHSQGSEVGWPNHGQRHGSPLGCGR